MKLLQLLPVLLFLQPAFANAQQNVQTPEKNQVDRSLIKNETYSMVWYALKDTAKVEIGKVDTQILKSGNRITVNSTVKMKDLPDWKDETIAGLPDFAPVKHTSFNVQRDMLLDFEKPDTVTGYYLDKTKNSRTEISETTAGKFFDSNLYTQLIRWLPLKEGYTTEMAIFDYNPSLGKGIMKAYVTGTKKGTYKNKPVWMVSVTDDISQKKAASTYYIDSKTRELLKQEVNMGPRKMLMERL
ncbi:hypothetical protein QE422_002865 [Chryseobacterium sp. SORGH_AS 447]|uniref:DUF3108 domain-containing protein n=1 Tax=Chryseobacterium sp. SORGH_AS_0447 TaxID=3041769 RepID=UPI00278B3F73|nr:hypothetical protein [Chryseobacterium sp. SORGH_AS_0447]MDQ1162497.1 hypothetical protein [Chryseobacterium sp. SORGH_AS_0447]